MEGAFNTAQLAKILNRNVRFVVDWTERGLIIADLQAASGHGSRRKFSYVSILRARLALLLHEKYRFNRAELKDILDKLWEEGLFSYLDSFKPNNSESKKESVPEEPCENNNISLILILNDGKVKAIWDPTPLSEKIIVWLRANVRILTNVNEIQFIALDLRQLISEVDSQITQL